MRVQIYFLDFNEVNSLFHYLSDLIRLFNLAEAFNLNKNSSKDWCQLSFPPHCNYHVWMGSGYTSSSARAALVERLILCASKAVNRTGGTTAPKRERNARCYKTEKPVLVQVRKGFAFIAVWRKAWTFPQETLEPQLLLPQHLGAGAERGPAALPRGTPGEGLSPDRRKGLALMLCNNSLSLKIVCEVFNL